MTRSRLTPLLLCLAALVCLTGCDYSAYRMTFEMEANNTATAHALGRQPSMRITNHGPGEVQVRFFADKYPIGERRTLQTGDTTEEALGGDLKATLETAEGEAQVKVEVETARKLVVDPATPK